MQDLSSENQDASLQSSPVVQQSTQKPKQEKPPEDPLRTLLKSLKHFSIKDLEEIGKKVVEVVEKKKNDERKAALQKIREEAEEHGFTPEEVFGKRE